MCPTRKDSESEWLTKDNPETNPITIKPKTASHVTELFSWVLLPFCSPPRGPFPIKPLALSAHVSPWTIHFWVLDKSPVLGPGRGPPSCDKWWPWWDSSSLRLTSWPLGVLTGQLFCQWTRLSSHNWDPVVPGLLLTQTIGQSTPTGKEQETLSNSLPFPLSFLSLTLPILPFFFLVFWSCTQESGQRASAWAEDWRLITSSWQRTRILVLFCLVSGRAEFHSSLLWRLRVKSHNTWVSADGRRHL